MSKLQSFNLEKLNSEKMNLVNGGGFIKNGTYWAPAGTADGGNGKTYRVWQQYQDYLIGSSSPIGQATFGDAPQQVD